MPVLVLNGHTHKPFVPPVPPPRPVGFSLHPVLRNVARIARGLLKG